jgi:hypothetical protein
LLARSCLQVCSHGQGLPEVVTHQPSARRVPPAQEAVRSSASNLMHLPLRCACAGCATISSSDLRRTEVRRTGAAAADHSAAAVDSAPAVYAARPGAT